MLTTARLFGEQFGSKSEISRVRYDNEYSLGRVVPFRNKSTQQRMRAFFHGMDAKEWGADQIKWGISCQHHHITIRVGVSGGSRTRRTLPQLSRRYNFSANSNRPWTSPAKKRRYIAIMQPPLVSRITLSNDNDRERWKCEFFGSGIKWHKICTK